MPTLSPQGLQGLRTCLRPEYADLRREHLEQVVASSVNDLPQPVAEDVMKALSSLGNAVAPTLQRAAPGIIQGAATGASVGGPWGALIGAGAGLASSASGSAGPKHSAPTGSVPKPASSPSGTPVEPPALSLPTGQSAAATLVSLLQNQAVLRALMSPVFGSSGSPQVTTAAGTTLPRGAINGLLMQLLANASEGLSESESLADQSYLQDASGEYLIDPASFDQQAALVLSQLQSEGAPFRPDLGEFFNTVEWMPDASEDSDAELWLELDESSKTVRFY
jgi:hypothetical protein